MAIQPNLLRQRLDHNPYIKISVTAKRRNGETAKRRLLMERADDDDGVDSVLELAHLSAVRLVPSLGAYLS